MTKRCGLSKLFAFLVAGSFCLTLVVPQSRAETFPPDVVDPATLFIGDGVTTSCYAGGPGCFAWDSGGGGSPDELTLVLDDEFNIFQNQGGASGLTSPILLLLGVPLENLLYNFDLGLGGDNGGGPQFNSPLDPGDVFSAALFKNGGGDPPWEVGDPSTAVPVTMPQPIPANSLWSGGWPGSSFANDGTDILDGTAGKEQLYADILGLEGPGSQSYTNWAQADVDVPADIICLGDATCISNLITPSGFMIFAYLLDTNNFDAKDGVNIIYNESFPNGIPLGTFVAAWGLDQDISTTRGTCSVQVPKENGRGYVNNPDKEQCEAAQGTWTGDVTNTPYSTPITRGAILMPIPEGDKIPEPTSLLLLGTGLLVVGRQWRKRQQEKKQDIV